MSAKKKPVSTPLHLLQQLSDSLLEHLEEACAQALADAEKLLSKLEKQRVKAQDKLHDARAKLQDSAKAGKAKAQGKAQKVAGELEELLDSLKQRQSETRTYIQQLKRDAQESLKLAQGVGKVREAASKALEQRTTDAKAGPADAPNKAAPAPGKPAPAKPVPRKPAPGKPAAGRTTASTPASS
uniref:AlgP family protein n=1 Tax=Pseudomonas sp. TaxID=306 RepID=UPI0028B0DD2A